MMALPLALQPVGTAVSAAVTAAAPVVKSKFTKYVVNATQGKAKDALAYIQANKNALAVGVTAAIKAGIRLDDVFSQDWLRTSNDQEFLKLYGELKSELAAAYGKIDSTSIIMGDDVHVALSVCREMQQLFPGLRTAEALRRAHAALRLFSATSEENLNRALNTAQLGSRLVF